MAKLLIKSGPLAGQALTLSGEALTLGRAPGNDLLLNDDLVSRQHARLYREGDSWWIEDRGSRNGLLINEQPAVSARLQDGDLFQVGASLFLFQEERAAAPPPAPELRRTLTAGGPRPAAAPPPRRRRFSIFWLLPALLVGGYLALQFRSPGRSPGGPELQPTAATTSPTSAKAGRRERKLARASYSKGLFNLQIGDRKKALDFFRQAFQHDLDYQAARIKIEETTKELRQEIEDHLVAGDRELERLQPAFAIIEYQRALSLARDFDPGLEARARDKIKKAQVRQRELEQSDAQN